MKQTRSSEKKFQWVSGLLLSVIVILAFGKPILAAETMINASMIEMRQDMLSADPGSHLLLDRDSDGILRSDVPMSDYTMVCCTQGEEKFSLANQISPKLVKELGFFPQGAGELCEYIPQLLREANFLLSGEIIFLSNCQRE